MAMNDIYRITVHYELPTSRASWSLYYKETVASTGGDISTQILAEAFDTVLATPILNMLANDCQQPAIVCERVFDVSEAKFIVNHVIQVGTRGTEALPNNASLVVGLSQSTFSRKSNGRIRIPGVPEGDTDTDVVSGLFNVGPYTAFTDALALVINELSAGAGRWTLGVISAKVRDLTYDPGPPPTGFKDWSSAFAPVTSIVGNTIIGILRKRQSKVFGQTV